MINVPHPYDDFYRDPLLFLMLWCSCVFIPLLLINDIDNERINSINESNADTDFQISLVNLHNPLNDKLIMTQILVQTKQNEEHQYQNDQIKQQKLLEVSCTLD